MNANNDHGYVAENIDRLMRVQLKPTRPGLEAFQDRVYEAARAMHGQPLSLEAALRLQGAVQPGRNVLFCTGAGTPPALPYGETDGPTGTAVLARAVHYGLGGKPIVVSERFYWDPVVESMRAVGLLKAPLEEVAALGHKVGFVDFPDDEHCEELARMILDDLDPVAIIAVEKTGPNDLGVVHSATGEAKIGNARIDHLFRLGRERGALTIGIGDWGNEIGMGNVKDVVKAAQPYGTTCLCPCGGGVADATETDVLVAAAIANWGAYAVAAMLAILVGNPKVFHDADLERLMTLACTRGGAGDGATRMTHGDVDGTALVGQQWFVGLLSEIVREHLEPPLPIKAWAREWEDEMLRQQGALIGSTTAKVVRS